MKYVIECLKFLAICGITVLATSAVWWWCIKAHSHNKEASNVPPVHNMTNSLPADTTLPADTGTEVARNTPKKVVCEEEKDIELVRMDISARNTNGYSFEDHSLTFRRAKSLPGTVINQTYVSEARDDRRQQIAMADNSGNGRIVADTSPAPACNTNSAIAQLGAPPACNTNSDVALLPTPPPQVTPQPQFEVLGCDQYGEKILVLSGHPGWFWYHGSWRQHCPQIVAQNQAQPQYQHQQQNVVVWERQPPVLDVVAPPQPCYQQTVVYGQGGGFDQNCVTTYRQGYVVCAPSVNYGYCGSVSFGYGGSGRGTWAHR